MRKQQRSARHRACVKIYAVLNLGVISSVFFSVSLHCLFSMSSSVNGVSPRCVSMVRCLFVMSGLVVFRRLRVVVGGVRKMF